VGRQWERGPMLKNAMLFGFAGLLAVLAAPQLLPQLKAPPSSSPQLGEPINTIGSGPAITAQPVPVSASASQSFRELDIPADDRGQYYIEATIDGERVPFLVDTGASIVSISNDVAERLGLFENADSPHYMFQTANGSAKTYGVTLKAIDLGSIYVDNVVAAVNPNMGGVNLLGANFLKRLNSVEQRNGQLILKQ